MKKDDSVKKPTIKSEVMKKIDNYKPSKSNTIVGYVYVRILIKNGMMYIGETTNMLDRQYHWLCLNVEYGGKEIEDIRHTTVPADWIWGILMTVEASTLDELKRKLKEEEAKYILQYETYKKDKGFNSTYGLSQYLKEANAA